jgi:N-dimethylarginine dimethylaminohydrolase
LLVGIGYRTNEDAVPALEAAFPGVEVVPFDLLHWNGAAEVMHLMSFISPLDNDLAVVYLRIAPVRLLRFLADRGISVVEVPDEEFSTQGSNVLALGPRRALALDGNTETRKRMERAGVEVTVYRGDEISKKGDGGPTCLTRPLLRD